MKSAHSDNRSFLFLQGVASPFFKRLTSALNGAGVQTCRVEFCGGDVSLYRHGSSKRFVGKLEQLSQYYTNLLSELKVTDIVLFGDTRPVHTPAIKLAKSLGIQVHVYEEGYLRPDWITLDSGGVNAFSPFADKAPNYFRQRAKDIPKGAISYKTGYSQWVRLFHDLRYNTARMPDFFRFPNYVRHRIDHPINEYIGWAKRHIIIAPRALQAKHQVNKIIGGGAGYYVYPLQLAGDSQIRMHSPFEDVNQATQLILQSFAKHAPKGTKLVVKNHPLDTGLSECKKFTQKISQELGIENRVVFIDGGHLPTLLQHAKGTVLINSTTGMSALFHQSPTIALGKAIYDMPGLTFQGGIDNFWRRAKKSDYKLFKDFRDVLVHDTQINGNFYTSKGINMAVSESLKRFGIVMSEREAVYLQSSMERVNLDAIT